MLSETEEKLINLIKNSKKESLLPEEKEAVKSHLISFIKKNPAIKNTHLPAVYRWYRAYFSNVVALVYARPALRYVSLVALVLFVGGGSVAFAAQHAQPGEFLYSVKTGVSEKVLALTLFSDQAKAEYTINLAQLRLQETETAVAQNKLNSETSAEVRLLFNDHVTDIQNRIANINAKEDARIAIELNSQLEALLKAHAKIIGNLAGKNEKNKSKDTDNILSDIKNKTDQITKTRESSESKLSLQTSKNAKINAENKLQEAVAMIKEANGLVISSGADISASSLRRAEADLARANQNITEGKNKLELEDHTSAFIFFQNSVRLAQEVNIYISNQSRLKLEFKLPPLQFLDDETSPDSKEGENPLDDSGVIPPKLPNVENQLKINISN